MLFCRKRDEHWQARGCTRADRLVVALGSTVGYAVTPVEWKTRAQPQRLSRSERSVRAAWEPILLIVLNRAPVTPLPLPTPLHALRLIKQKTCFQKVLGYSVVFSCLSWRIHYYYHFISIHYVVQREFPLDLRGKYLDFIAHLGAITFGLNLTPWKFSVEIQIEFIGLH